MVLAAIAGGSDQVPVDPRGKRIAGGDPRAAVGRRGWQLKRDLTNQKQVCDNYIQRISEARIYVTAWKGPNNGSEG